MALEGHNQGFKCHLELIGKRRHCQNGRKSFIRSANVVIWCPSVSHSYSTSNGQLMNYTSVLDLTVVSLIRL